MDSRATQQRNVYLSAQSFAFR